MLALVTMSAFFYRYAGTIIRRRLDGQARVFADWTKAEDLFLLRPQTFMNNSGRAVAAAAHFWRLSPEQIVVIHDEVDLAPVSPN